MEGIKELTDESSMEGMITRARSASDSLKAIAHENRLLIQCGHRWTGSLDAHE